MRKKKWNRSEMERDILFKAKVMDWQTRPKDNGWVEGNYIKKMTRTGCIYRIQPLDSDCFAPPIDPNTLSQCTGLQDKKKQWIWENDLVRCKKRIEEYEIYKVVWRKEFADFGVEPVKPPFGVTYPIGLSGQKTLYGRDYEVIGNIFDHSEWLKQANKVSS